MQSTSSLLEFFSNSIARVLQLLAKYELDDESFNGYWSSEIPVLLFTVEGGNGDRTIAIAGRATICVGVSSATLLTYLYRARNSFQRSWRETKHTVVLRAWMSR